MASKLMGARSSTRAALQSPSISAFLKAPNTDAVKFGMKPSNKKKKKGSSGIGMA
jgi:hypothetical protein